MTVAPIAPSSEIRKRPCSTSSWLADLRAGFIVSLVALPLCLGISMASNFPPVSGILTAVVGGLVATFAGSAKLTIKGPAAGLVAIALAAVNELGGGDPALGYRRALAVVVVAGLLQILLSRLRAGVLGDIFPTSVVHGLLAAIGIIICSKQVHTLLGASAEPGEPLELLLQVPRSIAMLNPEIAFIGMVSLLVLVLVPRIPHRLAKQVPVPMLVVVVAMLLGWGFDLEHEHHYHLGAHDYVVGPQALVNLPSVVMSAFTFPDFSVVARASSLKYIVAFALVGSIESILTAKAVESLDPARERTDVDRDLMATGIGTTVAGLLGGLPMISEVVRSSANVDAGAKSRWANFFHGLFLLVLVAAAPSLLHRIPTAALAAMLVHTGVRLASPSMFVKAWKVGPEQLVVLATTTLVALSTDMLVGLAAGIVMKVLVHFWNGMSPRHVLYPNVQAIEQGETTILRVAHQAVFANYVTIKKRLDAIPPGRNVVVDLSDTRLVDHTVLERLHHLATDWARDGRSLVVRGLDAHERVSLHPLSTRRRPRAG